jgi:cell shape-determining protein MreD
MSNNIKFQIIIKYLIFIAILIFTIVNYKISLDSPIYPSLDIIIIYHIVTNNRNYNLKYIGIFLVGLLLDTIYNSNIGINSLIFLITTMCLHLLPIKNFNQMNYLVNCKLFVIYTTIILYIRYITISSLFISMNNHIIIIMQIIITSCIYNIIKIIIELFNKSKNDNIIIMN